MNEKKSFHLTGAEIRAHLEIETEGDRSPCQTMPEIVSLESLLNNGYTANVLRLTPEQWGNMPAVQKRAMVRFTEQRLKALGEKLCMMRRLGVPDEPDLPAFLREHAAI